MTWSDSKETLRVVSVMDGALDRAAMAGEFGEYIRSRNPSLVRELPGARLTWFTLRRIPPSVYQRYVMTAESEPERHRRAFLAGVDSISGWAWSENGPLEDRVGTGRMRTATGEIVCWTDGELEHLPPAYIEEVGALVDMRSFLAGIGVGSYPVPQWLLSALAARRLHPAEMTPRVAEEASAPPPVSMTAPAAHVSAGDTVAIATESPTNSPAEA